MKLFIPIIDNGGQKSYTAWGMSMFMLGLSNVLRGHDVVAQAISYPYPAGAMNIASNDFLETDCQKMLIIDTDESFDPRHVGHLLEHEVGIVAGLYPKKRPGLEWVCEPIDQNVNPLENTGDSSLIEVARVARGFMLIDRSVFDRMRLYSDSYTDHETGKRCFEFWKTLPGGHSEDFHFCDMWRSIGGSVYIDKRVRVYHHGPIRFPIPGTY